MQKWRSGEVADLLNITKRTLQNWLRQEKIPRPQKNESGYYIWTDVDVMDAREYVQKLRATTRYRLRGHDK